MVTTTSKSGRGSAKSGSKTAKVPAIPRGYVPVLISKKKYDWIKAAIEGTGGKEPRMGARFVPPIDVSAAARARVRVGEMIESSAALMMSGETDESPACEMALAAQLDANWITLDWTCAGRGCSPGKTCRETWAYEGNGKAAGYCVCVKS